jgi:phage gpG-like protein
MIEIQFKPWRTFRAKKDAGTIRSWLRKVADASESAFKKGMPGSPPSSPGQYPAVRTGRLKGSIRTVVSSDEMTIGTNMHYSIYLRRGTRKMARRKMSDDALKEGLEKARGRLGHWVEWSRT